MPYLRIYLNNNLLDQFELTSDVLTIGRAPDNDIILDNPGVSSHHAVVETRSSTHVILDKNSTNGTFINNKRITSQELAFRDEIQIYNFVLKYMPRARLATTDDVQENHNNASEHAATVEITISDIRALNKLRKRNKTAYLVQIKKGQQAENHRLSGVHFTIGRSGNSNIRIGGWFAPKMAAMLIRQHNTYHLLPHKRGKVKVNGKPAREEITLTSGDHLSVRGKEYLFQYKTGNGR
ncbi:MAG TPA: FHA domain-containing protein [Thiolapillus brandeum]|uniref:FHA domain-containing protein n=1 Tax=Thiolapillus brandeum TaxID=1076588 RepID=A0A831NTV8_9GAMM|nr:FHA domain-containing protein [Thiolapillus brandeum]